MDKCPNRTQNVKNNIQKIKIKIHKLVKPPKCNTVIQLVNTKTVHNFKNTMYYHQQHKFAIFPYLSGFSRSFHITLLHHYISPLQIMITYKLLSLFVHTAIQLVPVYTHKHII